ncbi:MAG: class I SAM-dependent methyltransferase [Clostridia bacterium]|nr:class I SAM-dependent methyltransferase [Clostridia bacterium]
MIFVTPQNHKELVLNKECLKTPDGKESYPIIKNVPILLPEKTNPDWYRELLEIIFWEHPEEIDKIFSEIEAGIINDRNEIYVEHIKTIYGTKENILKTFDSYKQRETSNWIVGDKSGNISKRQLKDFKKFSKKHNGRKRTITKIKGTGVLWDRYRYFAEVVCKEKTDKILELATGAGGGTASVALYMSKDCDLYTVDIGFDCLGNAFGISKYQKKKIIPVCANFWYLPFKDKTFNTVCTVCGLDESREIIETLKEVSRVLTNNGRFIVTSRNNAFMRQYRILKPFGFTEKETLEILKDCRMYSDLNNLDEICNSLGMKLKSRKEYRDNENIVFSVSEYTK